MCIRDSFHVSLPRHFQPQAAGYLVDARWVQRQAAGVNRCNQLCSPLVIRCRGRPRAPPACKPGPVVLVAVAELKRCGWRTGFSVALPPKGQVPTQLDLDTEYFVQMEAVTDDHGTWSDPADYYATPLYRNRPGRLKLWLYALLIDRINAKVRKLRDRAAAPRASVGSAASAGGSSAAPLGR